jgi:peroxiredoxin Q/BCP
VGISADPVGKQHEFSGKYGFDFPLLSDPDKSVAEAFGVRRGGLSFMPNKRATFVIGADGTVKDIVTSEFNMNIHADRALAALRPV